MPLVDHRFQHRGELVGGALADHLTAGRRRSGDELALRVDRPGDQLGATRTPPLAIVAYTLAIWRDYTEIVWPKAIG